MLSGDGNLVNEDESDLSPSMRRDFMGSVELATLFSEANGKHQSKGSQTVQLGEPLSNAPAFSRSGMVLGYLDRCSSLRRSTSRDITSVFGSNLYLCVPG